MPWYQDGAWVIKILALMGAIIAMWLGQTEIATVLIGLVGIGSIYNQQKNGGGTKSDVGRFLIPLVIASFFIGLMCFSCISLNVKEMPEATGEIAADIIVRHDEYVEFDPDITDKERVAYLYQSSAVKVFTTGEIPITEEGITFFYAIIARHDRYCNEDLNTSYLHRRINLRDSAILKRYLDNITDAPTD